jgi:hypothetical protein
MHSFRENIFYVPPFPSFVLWSEKKRGKALNEEKQGKEEIE